MGYVMFKEIVINFAYILRTHELFNEIILDI